MRGCGVSHQKWKVPSVLTATFIFSTSSFFFFFFKLPHLEGIELWFFTTLRSSASLFLAPAILHFCLSPFLAQCEVFSLCFILILEVKWPSCTSGSNRWQRPCSLVVPGCDENRRPHKKKEKLLRSGFVCKYKSVQKREPETVSDVECFHSAVLDMDYIFFNMGVICGPLVGREGLWESGACRLWAVRKVGWDVLKRWRVHRLLKMVTEGHEKCESRAL